MKRYIAGAIVIATILATPTNALAVESSVLGQNETPAISLSHVSVPFSSNEKLNDGPISIKEQLVINGETYYLLPTYDDENLALTSIYTETSKTLDYLRESYDLGVFSDATWKSYQEAQIKMFDEPYCPNWYRDDNDSFMKLNCFFDIYENGEDNAQTIEKARTIGSRAESPIVSFSQAADTFEELLLSLPDQDTLGNKTDHKQQQAAISDAHSISMYASFNKANAIDYASKYATSPNASSWGYMDGKDCTNFASQILIAGGKNQVVTNNENTGWWHKANSGKHTYSLSWQRADSFAKYKGVSYKTTNNTAFSYELKKGNFIGLDYHSDGKWDHIGFVTNKATETTKGAYDYKVAQHSRNYHAWTSDSLNSWETAGGEYNSTYGVIPA